MRNVLAFQGPLAIPFLFTMGNPSQPKIRIMTATPVTVPCPIKEAGGTKTVITPT